MADLEQERAWLREQAARTRADAPPAVVEFTFAWEAKLAALLAPLPALRYGTAVQPAEPDGWGFTLRLERYAWIETSPCPPAGLCEEDQPYVVRETEGPRAVAMRLGTQSFRDWERRGTVEAQAAQAAYALLGVAWEHGLLPPHPRSRRP